MLDRAVVSEILPLFTGFVFVLGCIVGSFLNVVVWRLPRGESLSHPGSHCPGCGHAIAPWENIPILSWLVLRGRCSGCRQPISRRYPLVELANGLLFALLWWRLWTSPLPLSCLWGHLFLGAALLSASLIDIEHFLIPDAITFSGLVVAAGLALVFPETHLGLGSPGLPGGEQLITGAVLERLGPARRLLDPPRLRALFDALLGMAVGYALLRLLLEAGRRLWGRTRERRDEPVTARLTAEGIRIGDDDLDAAWEDLLVHRGDAFTAVLAGEAAPAPAASASAAAAPGRALRVTASTVILDGASRPLAEQSPLDLRLVRWEYPREVMGHGDLKFLAMIGGFLGPDATVFVLMGAAFCGCAWGLVRNLLCPSQRGCPLPFGPFLAAATLLWILGGEAFVTWYGRLLAGPLR
ncbi:MAG: prepilin peptidase [Lentisphaerae bacterium]|nr:prepilin peptidase [Lentisphaerota bacterium]